MYKNQIIDDLSARWERSGLSKGDNFLLHSNIKRLILEFKNAYDVFTGFFKK